MSTPQPGILAPIPAASRHLFFHVNACHDAPRALQALRGLVDGFAVVVGIGAELAAGLDAPIPGLRPFPSLPGARVPIPYVPYALWCWLRGSDRGELFHTGREIENALAGVFTLELAIDCFCHRDSRDLTGYEDGTENPVDEAALAAAIVSHEGDGLDGVLDRDAHAGTVHLYSYLSRRCAARHLARARKDPAAAARRCRPARSTPRPQRSAATARARSPASTKACALGAS